jgi:apolipoprotein N-acyltransferase
MTVDSLDAAFYACVFILPGFIIKGIIDAMNPPQKANDGALLLGWLAFCIANCAVNAWAYAVVKPIADMSAVGYWIAVLGVTAIGSAAFSLIIGLIKKKQLMRKMASRILHIQRPSKAR